MSNNEAHHNYEYGLSQPEAEIVPIDRARFTDKLEPEYEALWQELITKAQDRSNLGAYDFVLPLWADESFPQIFRDRAMLLLYGNSHTEQMSEKWRFGIIFSNYMKSADHSLRGIKHKYDFEYETFMTWIDDARAYGNEHSEVISDETYRQQLYAYFDLGLYDQKQFETALDELNPHSASPKHGWDSYNEFSYSLSPHRFPYLDDIFESETTNSTALKQWAKQKFIDFLTVKNNQRDILPHWMQNIPDDSAISLLRSIYRQRGDHSVLEGGFRRYGWDHFINKKDCWSDVQHLIGWLPGDLSRSLIAWTLDNYMTDAVHLHTENLTVLESHIRTLPDFMPFLMKIQAPLAKSREKDQERARMREELYAEIREKERKKIENDPEYTAARESREQYNGLLNAIRLASVTSQQVDAEQAQPEREDQRP